MVTIKNARIQKFRLRRGTVPTVGLIPEIRFSVDKYGVQTGKHQFELFGTYPCNVSFLVAILDLFNLDYTYELASQYASIAFVGNTPIGFSNSECKDWLIFSENEYKKISNKQLKETF